MKKSSAQYIRETMDRLEGLNEATLSDGRTVKVGDIVGFKSDIEQEGKVTKIRGNRLIIKALTPDGFEGDYIGGEMYTDEDAQDCWFVGEGDPEETPKKPEEKVSIAMFDRPGGNQIGTTDVKMSMISNTGFKWNYPRGEARSGSNGTFYAISNVDGKTIYKKLQSIDIHPAPPPMGEKGPHYLVKYYLDDAWMKSPQNKHLPGYEREWKQAGPINQIIFVPN